MPPSLGPDRGAAEMLSQSLQEVFTAPFDGHPGAEIGQQRGGEMLFLKRL